MTRGNVLVVELCDVFVAGDTGATYESDDIVFLAVVAVVPLAVVVNCG